jgi:putative ABC transport system ATP-binding protein
MTAVLELAHVGKSYDGAGSVLVDVNLDVCPGELLTIVGRSGSGKSTLLNILGLLDRPTCGTYTLGGRDMTGASDTERDQARGSHLGFVFQAYHLLPNRTVVENVELGVLYGDCGPRARREQALALLDRFGLSVRAHDRPAVLSGGERQRVAIARALMGSPTVLLCDEPTGNLDVHNATLVLELLGAAAASGVAVLVVTHDAEVAARGDRCLEVQAGRLSVRTPA